MNDEYDERGLFKQLVLILFACWIWIEMKAEQLWHSEGFWWFLCVLFAAIALMCLKVAVVE